MANDTMTLDEFKERITNTVLLEITMHRLAGTADERMSAGIARQIGKMFRAHHAALERGMQIPCYVLYRDACINKQHRQQKWCVDAYGCCKACGQSEDGMIRAACVDSYDEANRIASMIENGDFDALNDLGLPAVFVEANDG